MRKLKLMALAVLMLAGAACRETDSPVVVPTDYENVSNVRDGGEVAGFYVLNEGNMGANKATLDYFDYVQSRYIRNLYPERNPGIVLELGDSGNDIAVYGARLYAVINGSNKVEVLDAGTAISVGHVDVASPRFLAFDENYCYVSSYVGGEGDKGSVVRFKRETLEVEGLVSVGLAPEEMVIADGYLYVANSANFATGEFDNTISVIRLSDFTVQGSITVDINLHRLRTDADGNLWVSSRGNYYDVPSNLYKLERKGVNSYGEPQALDVDCSNFAIYNGKLYYYGVAYDENWNATNYYGVVDVATAKVVSDNFITDGTESRIMSPYCIAVQPSNGDIFITDARNYVSSGALYCYSPEGKLQWTVTTGDIPGHIAFVKKR